MKGRKGYEKTGMFNLIVNACFLYSDYRLQQEKE